METDPNLPDTSGGSVPPPQPPEARASKKSKRKVMAVSAAALLLLGAAGAAYALLGKDKQSGMRDGDKQSVSLSGNVKAVEGLPFADKFIPKLSDVRGYAELGQEHWYATFKSIIATSGSEYKVYSQHQVHRAMTSFTDVVVYEGKIWIAGQGGVARMDSESSFKEYLSGVSNPKLFVDKADNTLYVGTFDDGVQKYDAEADSFSMLGGEAAPLQADAFASKDGYLITRAPNHSESNDPIRLYNKQSKTWSIPGSWAFSKEGQRSSEVSLMTVDEEVIVYGRDVEYLSCEQHGQKRASVFYQFNSGSFTELTELTELFKDNEAGGSDSDTSLEAHGGCTENDNRDSFAVDLYVKDGKVSYRNKRALDQPSIYAGYSYTDRVIQLQNELGFAADIYLRGDGGGRIISNWAGPGVGGLVASGSIEGSVESTEVPEDESRMVRTVVECDGTSYAISSTGEQDAFTGAYLLGIYKFDAGKLERIYETTNKPVYEGVEAELLLANHDAVCSGGKLVLLGRTDIAVFDPVDRQLVKTPHGGQTSTTMSQIAEDRASFFYLDYKRMALVQADADAAAQVVTPIKDRAFNPEQDALLGVTDKYFAVVHKSGKSGENTTLTSFSRSGAAGENTNLVKYVHGGGQFDGSRFVIQYVDGETKLVNYADHRSQTISKSASVSSQDDFAALVIEPSTRFIVDEGYLWFTAQNWGLVGYKAD